MTDDRLPVPTLIDSNGCLLVSTRCVGCGHELQGLTLTSFCPNCGIPLRESATKMLPLLDADCRLDENVACINCGYNLRTRRFDERCPECAADVAASIRSDYLHLAPLDWLKRITGGAAILFYTITFSLAFPVLAIILGLSLASSSSGPPMWFFGFMIISFVLGLAFLILIILGVVKLTVREPGSQYRDEGLSARKLARISLILMCVSFVASIFFMPTITLGLGGTPFASVPYVVLMLIAGVSYFLLPLALLKHVGGLMRRIPRTGLVTYCKILFGGLIVCGVLYVVCYPIMMWNTTRMVRMAAMTAPNMPGTSNCCTCARSKRPIS